MAMAKVRDSHLTYNGIRYFRANSEEIELGSYGEKRTPIFGTNYLEVYKNIPFGKLEVEDVVTVDIDYSTTSESDLSVGGSFKVLGVGGSGKVGNIYGKLRSGELSLVKFSVKRGDMVDAINASPRARDKIDDLGNDARVAHQIFVVMDAKLAESMTSTTNFDVSVDKGDINVSVAGSVSKGGKTSVTLSEKSTLAYLLLSLVWDSKSKKKRTKIKSAKDDQWSFS